MKKQTLSLFIVLVMVYSIISSSLTTSRAVETTESDDVKSIVDNMSLRDKVTQMMMVDFRLWNDTDFTVMNDEVRTIIEDYNFGSVILFANNIKETEQSFNLVTEMQAAATKDGGIAMIITADQEGGSVYRLGSGTALPGNMALGATYATHNTKYAVEAGRIIGSELSVLGINSNLAPVVDVNNNANNPVIGLRSYGDDATMVGELAAATILGMAEYNVIGCAKHFPGHGDTDTDSHYGLPIVDKSLNELLSNELKPYELAIEHGVEMIMTAHILYPQLESDKIVSTKTGKAESLPATLSDDILTKLLKEQMGFKGIITTDAMNMTGISGTWNQLQSVILAIQAGVDMLCMPVSLHSKSDLQSLDVIINGVIDAVNDGTIPMSRIDDAVTRILAVKKNRGILNYDASAYSLEKALSVVGCEKNREMEREIAAAAVTVTKNDNNVLPIKLTESSKVLMLVPYSNETALTIMAWNRAKEKGLVPSGAEVDYYRFSNDTISSSLRTKLNWADTYIIISEVSSTARMEYKHWLSSMPNKLCNYAADNDKTAIVASCDKPYDVQMYPNANAILAAYGCKGSSVDPTEALIGGATGSNLAYGPNIIAAVEVALGVFDAGGKLPLNIPKYNVNANTYTANSIIYTRGYGLTYNSLLDVNVTSIDDISYTVDGNVVTVEHDAWVVAYLSNGENINVYGTKNSDGTYSFTAPFDTTKVVIQAKAVTTIAVTSLPHKLIYIENEEFDTAGLELTAYYNNGTEEIITDYTVDGYTPTEGTKTITVSYAGYTDTFVVTVKYIPSNITSDAYAVGDDYIDKINAGTTAKEFLLGINEAEYCVLFDGKNIVSDSELIATGMTVKIMFGDTVKASYTVIVTGDVDGDAIINASDYLNVIFAIRETAELNDIEQKAADVDGDNSITATDYLIIKTIIKATYTS